MKLKKILLSLNSLIKSIDFDKFHAATKFNYHIEVNDLPFKNALVLAPHPDDEVFGTGGTLKKISDQGGEITVVYFCDGAAGNDGSASSSNAPIRRDPRLAERRRKEAVQSSKILGIKNQVFFGFEDGNLSANTITKKAFVKLIEEVKPDIMFVPSFLDNHPDHKAVNQILLSSKFRLKKMPEIWAYQVWTPIWINRLVPINSEIEAKKKAMKVHLSQLESRNYDEAILGLSRYWAEINNIPGYAEGFFASTYEMYKKLYKNK